VLDASGRAGQLKGVGFFRLLGFLRLLVSPGAPQTAAQPIVSSARGARHRVYFAAVAMAVQLAAVLVLASPARAAFPGRDGLLAVQPLRGPGIVLVNADGRDEQRVCAAPGDSCAVTSTNQLVGPRWAPDGRTLVINQTEGLFDVIYPDGSCLYCEGLTFAAFGQDAAFGEAALTSNPTLLTAVTTSVPGGVPGGELVEFGVDGFERRVLLSDAGSDPVWSSRGQLALARGGWIWAGNPSALRRVTRGSAPSWSPDGARIVFVRRGWLLAGAVRGRVFRRLVRGADPAWSPDGGSIAFFDRHHRLSLVRARGGRARRISGVTGWTVDWQPLPAKPPVPCLTPPGSTVVATSDTAIVTVDNGQSPYSTTPSSAYLGCFRADGRERLLFTSAALGYATVSEVQATVAGPYAALATEGEDGHASLTGSGLGVYDLRTGTQLPDRGGEGSMCAYQSSPPCLSTIDQVVLGSDAVSAVHMTIRDANCAPVQQPNCMNTTEQIQASDATGVHTLDSITEPDGSPAALTDLILTGDTLTWENNGTQHSAQLQP
jgi:hypothetical protein